MRALTPEEERAWIRQLRKRDERAFTQLVREFQTPVYNLVSRMMGYRRDEALDVAQEVFVTVFRAIDGFRGESKLSTWIYRIAVNHCRNRLKYLSRRRHERHDELDDAQVERSGSPGEVAFPRPDRALEGARAERFLQDTIAALDDEPREILVLRDIQGLTYEEIGEVTGLPDGTVKSRLHRARKSIQEAYDRWQGKELP